MNWQTLYSSERLSDLSKDKMPNPDAARNSFHRDYDRIIFSSAFRRLQNKTQVFPLPGVVFVHNRLTHSLEVASVGRSLGKSVGDMIAEKYKNEDKSFAEFYKYDLANVIASACLAHDIGNPPFGHSGEDAIRNYFRKIDGKAKEQFEKLTENQQKDFEYFEGNSNAFRLLTHRHNESSSAFNLTITTLAAIIKYPSTSQKGFNKKSGLIATKKSGFFDSEKLTYKLIAQKLGISQTSDDVYVRHPFVFLTEAADDVCYRIMDLEDAHRLRIVSLEKILALFLPFFENEKGYFNIDSIKNRLNNILDDNQKVQYLRARWIGLMTHTLAQAFMDNEEKLLSGSLQQSLLDLLPGDTSKLVKAIDDFSIKEVYNYKSVVEIEIAGFNVIGELLSQFVNAVISPEELKNKKLLQLIPNQFYISAEQHHIYQNLQSVTDFVSGMTDLYAVDLYKKITGIEMG